MGGGKGESKGRKGGRGAIRDREMSKPGVGMDIQRTGEAFYNSAPVISK